MRQAINRIPSFRFRRWSRKAYAAFTSIGRHVTIGCVHKNIADKSLAKQACTGTTTVCDRNGQTHRDSVRQQSGEGAPPGAPTDIEEWTKLMHLTTDREVVYRDNVAAGIRYTTSWAKGRSLPGCFSEVPAFLMSALTPLPAVISNPKL